MGGELTDEGSVLDRWRRWINLHWGELIYLLQQREIVRDTLVALEGSDGNNIFADALFQMYVRYQSIGVRRLIDRGRDTYSLNRLLNEAMDHRELLIRDDFVQSWVSANPDFVGIEALANEYYDKLWGAGVEVPATASIAAELRKLAQDTEAVRKFTNWTQAHMVDKRPDPLTLGALEQAVDDVTALFQRWAMIVSRNHLEVARIGGPDWREPLRVPLFHDQPSHDRVE